MNAKVSVKYFIKLLIVYYVFLFDNMMWGKVTERLTFLLQCLMM